MRAGSTLWATKVRVWPLADSEYTWSELPDRLPRLQNKCYSII